mmetsp:Transcript_65514/g.191742  ORF Transcript_65514/g.191742 Transcript_65514/m.191742 type:complete len:211 (+) Transcript_65514:165-797(+)
MTMGSLHDDSMHPSFLPPNHFNCSMSALCDGALLGRAPRPLFATSLFGVMATIGISVGLQDLVQGNGLFEGRERFGLHQPSIKVLAVLPGEGQLPPAQPPRALEHGLQGPVPRGCGRQDVSSDEEEVHAVEVQRPVPGRRGQDRQAPHAGAAEGRDERALVTHVSAGLAAASVPVPEEDFGAWEGQRSLLTQVVIGLHNDDAGPVAGDQD